MCIKGVGETFYAWFATRREIAFLVGGVRLVFFLVVRVCVPVSGVFSLSVCPVRV